MYISHSLDRCGPEERSQKVRNTERGELCLAADFKMPFIENHRPDAMKKVKQGVALILKKRKPSEKGPALWKANSESNLLSSYQLLRRLNHDCETPSKQPDVPFHRIIKVQHVCSPIKIDVIPMKSSLRKQRTASEQSQVPKRVTFSMYALILYAASENLVSELEYLLDKDPSYINKPSSSGETALHKAAAKGHLECVQLLVNRGANANLPDKRGRTPLFISWEKEHLDCYKLLLSSLRKQSLADQED